MAPLIFVVALLVLFALWWGGNPLALDDGADIPKPHGRFVFRKRPWDGHSIEHLSGSAILAFALCVFGGLYWGAAAFIVGIAIELAQALPRGGGDGVADGWDLVWDALGVAMALYVCAAL